MDAEFGLRTVGGRDGHAANRDAAPPALAHMFHRLRFSLKTMLVGVTLCALGLALSIRLRDHYRRLALVRAINATVIGEDEKRVLRACVRSSQRGTSDLCRKLRLEPIRVHYYRAEQPTTEIDSECKVLWSGRAHDVLSRIEREVIFVRCDPRSMTVRERRLAGDRCVIVVLSADDGVVGWAESPMEFWEFDRVVSGASSDCLKVITRSNTRRFEWTVQIARGQVQTIALDSAPDDQITNKLKAEVDKIRQPLEAARQ